VTAPPTVRAASTYCLRVEGHLDDHWSSWFGRFTIARETDGTTTITVTYTGTASWPALRINEWMASNNSYLDPVDEDADDWLEIYNPTGAPVNLANWRLSDDPALPAKFCVAWTRISR